MKVGIICSCPLGRVALTTSVRRSGGCKDASDISSVDDFAGSGQLCAGVRVIQIAHIQELRENIRRLHGLCPNVPILAMLVEDRSECEEVEAIKAGARGLVSWDSQPAGFVKAMETVGGGEVWLSDKATTGYV